jgi:hypothetical protein
MSLPRMKKLSLVALTILSCSPGPSTVSADRSAISANPTSLVADGTTQSVVTVVARDTNGAPMVSATVTLQVTGAAPVVDRMSNTTGSDGATAFKVAATTAGTYSVGATINGTGVSRQATIVFIAGSGATLAVRTQPSSVQVGQVIVPPIVIEAHDSEGNVAEGFTGPVAIALTSAGGATLSGTTPVNAVAGVATFADLRVDKPGTYTLIATSGGLGAVNTASFDVTAGAPAKLMFTMPPAPTAAGATLAPVVVAARDVDGNALPGNMAQITLAIGNGPSGATLGGSKTRTATDGVATFSDLRLPMAGSYTLSATATGLAGAVSPSFTISAGAATHLMFTMQPTTVEVRNTFTAEVTVEDAIGNPVNGTDMVTLTASSGTTLTGTTSVAAVGGVARFSGLSFTDEGSITLTASSGSLLPGMSNAITVTDTTAPSNPALAVGTKTATSVSLNWSEVGDDGMLGLATSQELRWSTSAITAGNFMQATAVTTPAVASAGSAQNVTVTGLSANTQYYFALRVVDSAGNSAMATATATTTMCPAGFVGATCNMCDVGFQQADAGVCSDLCAPNPCTTPPPSTCNGNVATTYGSPGSCAHDMTTGFACSYTPLLNDCAQSSGVCVNGACAVVRAPRPGDFVVSEVMHTTTAGLASQWIELTNLSTDRIDLANAKLETVGTGGTSFTLPATPRVVLPKGTIVLGGSTDPTANGGAAVDVAWTGIDLSNPKHVRLSLGATVITELDYGAITPPTTADGAVQLSLDALAVGGDQQSWYWCGSTAAMSGGGLGTPNQPNGTCGMTLNPPIDWCVVQFPKALGALDAPVTATVYGRFYDPSVTDRNPNGNDNYPFVVGELGWGAPDAGPASWTWSRAQFNPGYVDSDPNTDNDEMMGVFAPATSGSYVYGYRFRMIDPATGAPSADTYCDQNGPVTDLTNATWGTASVLAPSADIAAARAAPNATGLALDINGAKVTYVKPAVGAEPAGFYLQADPTGPALAVAVDPTTLTPPAAVGDRVQLTVTSMADAGLAREALAITNYTRISSGNDVTALIQDVSDAGDLVSNITAYESELTRTSGTLSGGLGASGTGFLSAAFSTSGVPADVNLTLRLPQTVTDALDLAQGCTVTVTAPMGRFNNKVEVSGWATADVAVASCPNPKVTLATAPSATSAVVTFDRQLSSATLLADGSQFTADNGLSVSAAALSGPKQVTLTTSTQATNTTYRLTIAGTLHDLYGNGCVAPNNTTTFAGPGACMPSAVVISQVYGGGGNSGATYKNDFIELHNRSGSPQAIGGWSVQYASASGTTWSATPIPAGTLLAAGAYYLIQLASGGTPGIALPTPDATGTTNMSGTAGKVALAPSTTPFAGTCPTGAIDFVGYGAENCTTLEGSPTPTLSNTTSAQRASNGCGDTNMNSTDFSTGTPNARNTSTTASPCGCN